MVCCPCIVCAAKRKAIRQAPTNNTRLSLCREIDSISSGIPLRDHIFSHVLPASAKGDGATRATLRVSPRIVLCSYKRKSSIGGKSDGPPLHPHRRASRQVEVSKFSQV